MNRGDVGGSAGNKLGYSKEATLSVTTWSVTHTSHASLLQVRSKSCRTGHNGLVVVYIEWIELAMGVAQSRTSVCQPERSNSAL